MFALDHLKKLQSQLKVDGLKAYLIMTGDPHSSEYAASYFMAERLYFCPFSGDAGQVLITQDKAYLFTDGRFFIQAGKELAGSGFELMKIGEKGVLPLADFIKAEKLYPLGVNQSMISEEFYKTILHKEDKIMDMDYSYMVLERPELSKAKVFALDEKLNTLTRAEKIAAVLNKTYEKEAEANLITTLDDIAWILNLRGNDIADNPVFYAFLYLSKKDGAHLFIDPVKIDFPLDGVTLHPYTQIADFLLDKKNVPTLVDPNRVNARLFNILQKPVAGKNPSYLMKAIKGEKEIANTKEIQIIDGVAMLKFIAFLDDNLNKNLSEYDYAVALEGFRRENKRLFELSFETIAAVGSNAAMMHYGPSEAVHSSVNSTQIELLVDSGGQYYGGTTDTTRTFLIGKPTAEYIHDYTLTLKSVIALSEAIFIDGSCGVTLDILSRSYMWNEGMDYKCGTGHGVGYILNVHEGPNGFRYKLVPERDDSNPLVPGMITTVEPGVYKEGKYGIRIENNLLCVKAFETEMGTFYKFETITMVPIDVKALDLNLLTDKEISWLNAYHQEVFSKLSPLVEGHLLEVLKEKTKPISR
ncbi:MAG: aminopeptidase P family protein [Bacilli bacterium]|jgi:Xaa-Pro aminopeptidase|nr:aminopeptidase P family protein [Bacilli bacterium]